MAADQLGLIIGIEVKDEAAVRSITRTGKALDGLEKTADKTKKALSNAANDSDSALSNLDKRVNQVIGSFKGLAVIAGVGLIARGIQGTIDKVDELNDAAGGLNTTFRGLKTLEQVFTLGGSDPAAVQQILSIFNKTLAEAADNGDTTEQSFRRLGISMKDLKGLSSDQALVFILDTIGKLSKETDKVAIATDFFGKNYSKALRLAKPGIVELSNGIYAQNEGLDAQSEAINKAKEAQDKLNESWENAKIKLVGELAPGITALFPYLDTLIQKLGELNKFSGAFDLSQPFRFAAGVAKDVVSSMPQSRQGDILRANYGLPIDHDNFNNNVSPDFVTSSYQYNEQITKPFNARLANYGLSSGGTENVPRTGIFTIPKVPQFGQPVITSQQDDTRFAAIAKQASVEVNLFGKQAGMSKKDLEDMSKSMQDLAVKGFDQALKSVTKFANKIDGYFNDRNEKKGQDQLDKVFKNYEEKVKDLSPDKRADDQFNSDAADAILARQKYEANEYDTAALQDYLDKQSALDDTIAAQRGKGADVTGMEQARDEVLKFTDSVDKGLTDHNVNVNISVEPNENFWIKWSTDSKVVDGFTSLMTNIAASAARAGAK